MFSKKVIKNIQNLYDLVSDISTAEGVLYDLVSDISTAEGVL